MTPDHKTRLAAFLEQVWNLGDEDAVAAFVADRYTLRHDPGDPWHGQTLDQPEFRARLRAARAPFPDQRFTVRRMTAEGDTVAAAWTWQGTHRGEVGGIAPTGRRITMTGVTLYDFDEAGRITGHWQEVDRLGVYRQLAG
ncbi:MAG: DUF4440 domain-containing protein [Caulobacter sp.]|nr:DUF4440 domain-containing protein [Caulobacter sp.]